MLRRRPGPARTQGLGDRSHGRIRAVAAIPAAAAITMTVAAVALPGRWPGGPFPGPVPTGVRGGRIARKKEGVMLTPEAILSLAAELTDAEAAGDAASLAAIAWRLYGEAGENLAEIGRLRAAIHAAWTRPQETASPAPGCRMSGTTGAGIGLRQQADAARHSQAWPPRRTDAAVLAAAVGCCHPTRTDPGGDRWSRLP